MMNLWKRKFSLWDLMGIITVTKVLTDDITMIPECLVLGFLWILAGVIMEKHTK